MQKVEKMLASGHNLTLELDRTSDPADPAVRIECGCNEIWLDEEAAHAVVLYLQTVLPLLRGTGS